MTWKTPTRSAPAEAESAPERVIKEGSRAAQDGSETRPKSVLLTIPGSEHSRIEPALRSRRVRIPRHTLILEAMMEKLDREEGR